MGGRQWGEAIQLPAERKAQSGWGDAHTEGGCRQSRVADGPVGGGVGWAEEGPLRGQ